MGGMGLGEYVHTDRNLARVNFKRSFLAFLLFREETYVTVTQEAIT